MLHSSDSSLIVSCINGEKEAWDRFIQRFSRLIFWAILEKLKLLNCDYSQHDLEDIFQDVFILLWNKKKLTQVRNRKRISSWIVMVAANCTVNYLRNKEKHLVHSETLLEKIESPYEDIRKDSEQKKIGQTLDLYFATLPARENIIIKLCCVYDKTHQEIGQILRMPTNTISSIVKRTKEKLKGALIKAGLRVIENEK